MRDDGVTYLNSMILIVAKGSGAYDIYVGGRRFATDETPGTFQLYLEVTMGWNNTSHYMYLYVDDVRQSKVSIA